MSFRPRFVSLRFVSLPPFRTVLSCPFVCNPYPDLPKGSGSFSPALYLHRLLTGCAFRFLNHGRLSHSRTQRRLREPFPPALSRRARVCACGFILRPPAMAGTKKNAWGKTLQKLLTVKPEGDSQGDIVKMLDAGCGRVPHKTVGEGKTRDGPHNCSVCVCVGVSI